MGWIYWFFWIVLNLGWMEWIYWFFFCQIELCPGLSGLDLIFWIQMSFYSSNKNQSLQFAFKFSSWVMIWASIRTFLGTFPLSSWYFFLLSHFFSLGLYTSSAMIQLLAREIATSFMLIVLAGPFLHCLKQESSNFNF